MSSGLTLRTTESSPACPPVRGLLPARRSCQSDPRSGACGGRSRRSSRARRRHRLPSTAYWISGLSTTGSISLGWALAGRNGCRGRPPEDRLLIFIVTYESRSIAHSLSGLRRPSGTATPETYGLLIVEPLEPEVMQWLQRATRSLRAELALEPRAAPPALHNVRAIIVPPSAPSTPRRCTCAGAARHRGQRRRREHRPGCLRARGVEVVRARPPGAQAEAEFVIGALLSCCAACRWSAATALLVGRELGAATVGLVGMPPAARPLARLLGAFGSGWSATTRSLHASDASGSAGACMITGGAARCSSSADAVCVQLSYFSRYRACSATASCPTAAEPG